MNPLSRHRTFASEQVDEIRHKLASFYNDTALSFSPAKGRHGLSHELFAVPMGGITLTWPLGVDATAPCLEDTFDFCFPVQGTAL